MSDSHPQGVVPAHGHPHGPQPDETDVRGLARFTVWFLVTMVIILIGLVGLFAVFKARFDQADVPPLPLQAERQMKPAQGPPLQKDEIGDFGLWLARQKPILETGHVDPDTGVARIPIKEAMRLMAEEGRRPTTQPAQGGGGAR